MDTEESTNSLFLQRFLAATVADMDTSKEAIGSRIRDARKRRGLNQSALAEACGWAGSSTVSNYETGTRALGIEEIMVISKVLGESPEWLIFGRYFESPGEDQDQLLEDVISVVEEVLQATGTNLSPTQFAKLVANLAHDAKSGVDISRERVRNWVRLFV